MVGGGGQNAKFHHLNLLGAALRKKRHDYIISNVQILMSRNLLSLRRLLVSRLKLIRLQPHQIKSPSLQGLHSSWQRTDHMSKDDDMPTGLVLPPLSSLSKEERLKLKVPDGLMPELQKVLCQQPSLATPLALQRANF